MQLRRRTFRQFLIGSIAIFTLLADVGIAGLWVQSYYAMECVRWTSGDNKRQLAVGASQGVLAGALGRLGSFSFYGETPGFDHISQIPVDLMEPLAQRGDFRLDCRRFGFGILVRRIGDEDKRDSLLLPCWFLCLLASTIAAFFGRKFLRNRKLARSVGLCPHCGYDLRATSERCPECGHAVVV